MGKKIEQINSSLASPIPATCRLVFLYFMSRLPLSYASMKMIEPASQIEAASRIEPASSLEATSHIEVASKN